MRETITIATLKEFLAAFKAHDLDAIMEFFSDDCEFCMPRGKEPWGTRYVGKPAVREASPLDLWASPTSTMVRTATGWLGTLASRPGCSPARPKQANKSVFVASTC
jgi:hypothetical protein